MMRAALILLLAAAPGIVRAQVDATSDYLKRMDVDGDGRVSQIEFLDWMSYAFDARDADHDGVLSAQEQPGGNGTPLTRRNIANGWRQPSASRIVMATAIWTRASWRHRRSNRGAAAAGSSALRIASTLPVAADPL